MHSVPTMEEAWTLLQEYHQEEFHLRHARIVSEVLGYFANVELKSVKKKFKDKKFAAGCSWEAISQGAEMLGWSLDDLISRTILAMRSLLPEMDI